MIELYVEMGAPSALLVVFLPQICYPRVFVNGYGKEHQESLFQRDITTPSIFLECYSSTITHNEMGFTSKYIPPFSDGPPQPYPITICGHSQAPLPFF